MSDAGGFLATPWLTPDSGNALAGTVAADDIPVARQMMARGEPEYGFELGMPAEVAVVTEDKLVEIGV